MKPQPYLSEDEYKKAFTQMRMGMSEIFAFMRVDENIPVRYEYGFTEFVSGAIEEACRR